MKKIMSVFTSAVMALCIVSVFLTAAVTNSEEANNTLTVGAVVDKSFEGVTAELDGDAIRFITEYPEIIAGTEKEISLSRTDDGYLFKPMGDGRYVVLIMHYPPAEIPLYETFWFPPVESVTYEIEVKDNVVNINAVHWSYEKNDEKFIESFMSDGTSFTTLSDLGTIFGAYFLLISLGHELDPLFIYYIDEDKESSEIAEESLIMSDDENAEIYYIQGDNMIKDDGMDPHDRFPSVGEASLPRKMFDFICIPEDGVFETESGSLKIVLNEGKRSKVYEIDYEEYDPVPSSLKITVCPENDINADGSFNVADAVYLQSFLLGKKDRTIINWRASDICEDGILDVFDLVCIRKALIAAIAKQ